METCTHCGRDITSKKFCPDCGTPVQAAEAEAATTTCPRCEGTVKADAAFCMHCGSSLAAQAVAAVSAPAPLVSQPATRQCIACHAEVPASSAFCTNCGQSMQAAVAATPIQAFCTNCGSHNNPGAHFCNNCGQTLTPTAAPGLQPQTGTYQQPYIQQPSQYQPQPYGQPQYNPGYPPQQQYAQGGYQQADPMLGQQPMILRCPVCMAMTPLGTPNCPSCRTSLAGIVPTPSTLPMQGQQQGGLGGMFQGSGGNMAMGALGGAAAVIGGEMLLHGVERDFDRRRDYDDYGDRGGGGLLGELGNDLGLF